MGPPGRLSISGDYTNRSAGQKKPRFSSARFPQARQHNLMPIDHACGYHPRLGGSNSDVSAGNSPKDALLSFPWENRARSYLRTYTFNSHPVGPVKSPTRSSVSCWPNSWLPQLKPERRRMLLTPVGTLNFGWTGSLRTSSPYCTEHAMPRPRLTGCSRYRHASRLLPHTTFVVATTALGAFGARAARWLARTLATPP
jgi:hypothetical protein